MGRIIRRSEVVGSTEQKALAKVDRTLASFFKIAADAGHGRSVSGSKIPSSAWNSPRRRAILPAGLNERERRALRFHLAKGNAGIQSLVVAIADAKKR